MNDEYSAKQISRISALVTKYVVGMVARIAAEGKQGLLQGSEVPERIGMRPEQFVLFEPWGLGDSMIAFAIALHAPDRLSLACNSRWHETIRAVAKGMPLPELIAVDLAYGSRFQDKSLQTQKPLLRGQGSTILSIRGDLRDYLAARKFFPASRIRMNGWIPFLAKRSTMVDIPFSRGWLSVRSRYKAWASLAGVAWPTVEDFYRDKRPLLMNRSVLIHLGAQWRSKQYPQVSELAEILRKTYTVRIVAGPGDSLPEGIVEGDVSRLVNGDLVEALTGSSYVIANDSGPMHVAALLRCRTLVVTNHGAMKEWLPPTVIAVEADPQPGHRPLEYRPSDVCFDGWPAPEKIAETLETSFG